MSTRMLGKVVSTEVTAVRLNCERKRVIILNNSEKETTMIDGCPQRCCRRLVGFSNLIVRRRFVDCDDLLFFIYYSYCEFKLDYFYYQDRSEGD